MKSFDQRIYREEFRAKRQPKKKRGPYKCQGLTRDWKAYKRAYYASRIKNGICTSCGKPNPDSPARTTCGTCRARYAKPKTTTTP